MKARMVVAAWAVLVAAGCLLSFAARGAGPLPGDLDATRSLQGLPPDGPAGLVLLYAGDAAWFLPVLAFVAALLARHWTGALFLLLASVVAVMVGDVLKLLVERPRPPAETVALYDASDGYGFPSGTALLVLVALGVSCGLIRRSRAPRFVALVSTGLSAAVILAVGLSRVYVGEHWASDVLGGWIFGGALLLVMLALHHRWPLVGRRGDRTGSAGTEQARRTPRRGVP